MGYARRRALAHLSSPWLGLHSHVIGKTVGSYKIEERLGRGGMSELFLARDVKLGRRAALKFLPAKVSRDAGHRAQLLQEAQAASTLDHPNICTIYQVGETEDGDLYIAMAHYEGKTVSRIVRRETLPLDRAYEIAAQVAAGLAAAHRAGIVHRDVKPGNIMITDDGLVKILDFGIAELADVEHALGDLVVGTVPYMSPEQLRKQTLDPRTDLWSLGIVLYYMLTGRKPFKGPTQKETKKAILESELRPLSGFGDEVDDEHLNQVLGWLLTKDRDERYQNAEELLGDLQRAGDPEGEPLRGPGSGGEAELAADPAFARHTGVLDFTSTDTGRPSLAVLPFRDLSPEGDQAHLAYGLAEELITLLSGVSGIRIVRFSAGDLEAATGGDEPDLEVLARRLRVSHVLEGGVRRSAREDDAGDDGDRLRVTARLVRVDDGEILWSERYDRAPRRVFDIEEDIAGRIAEALEAPLLGKPPKARRPAQRSGASGSGEATAEDAARHGESAEDDVSGDEISGEESGEGPNLEAYEHYLRGRYRWNQRTDEGMREAIREFQAAIAEEPGFARAHAGLADCWTLLGIYGVAPPSEVMPRAKIAVETALELDPTLAEAHTSRGCVRSAYDWDLVGAASDFRRAIELDENYATAYQWYAMNALVPKKEFESALEQLEKAARLQPTSLPILTSVGLTHDWAGRPAAAVECFRRVLEIDAGFVLGQVFMAHALGRLGRHEEALEVAVRAGEISDRRPNVTAVLGVLHARLGHDEQAYWLAEKLMDHTGGRFVPPTLVAQVYATLGEKEMALSVLDRALRQRTSDLIWLAVDPVYEPLHQLDRFRQILWDLGLERRP